MTVSSFLPPTEKTRSSYQIFTCKWNYRTMLSYSACLQVFLRKSPGFCHIGINHPAMSRRHRPTEHTAVFLSKPFVALDDLFPNQAGTYLHRNLLVNTLALFYFLFLVILPTSAAGVCWSHVLQQVPQQPDANHGWQMPLLPQPHRSRVSPIARLSGNWGDLGRSHPASSTAPDISQARRPPNKPAHQHFLKAVWEGWQ